MESIYRRIYKIQVKLHIVLKVGIIGDAVVKKLRYEALKNYNIPNLIMEIIPVVHMVKKMSA